MEVRMRVGTKARRKFEMGETGTRLDDDKNQTTEQKKSGQKQTKQNVQGRAFDRALVAEEEDKKKTWGRAEMG